LGCSRVDGVIVGLDRRVGRDGRTRPVQAGEVRDRIREALEQNPTGSLRVIAAIAGASPETVRTVKSRLAVSGDEDSAVYHLPPPVAPEASLTATSPLTRPTVDADEPVMFEPRQKNPDVSWVTDAALLACEGGPEFACWFESNKVDEDWHRHLWSVPIGRVYEIVDEARRRARPDRRSQSGHAPQAGRRRKSRGFVANDSTSHRASA